MKDFIKNTKNILIINNLVYVASTSDLIFLGHFLKLSKLLFFLNKYEEIEQLENIKISESNALIADKSFNLLISVFNRTGSPNLIIKEPRITLQTKLAIDFSCRIENQDVKS